MNGKRVALLVPLAFQLAAITLAWAAGRMPITMPDVLSTLFAFGFIQYSVFVGVTLWVGWLRFQPLRLLLIAYAFYCAGFFAYGATYYYRFDLTALLASLLIGLWFFVGGSLYIGVLQLMARLRGKHHAGA